MDPAEVARSDAEPPGGRAGGGRGDDDEFERRVASLVKQLTERLKQQAKLTVMTQEQQLWLLRRQICSQPWLLAALEEPEWQRSVREAAAPELLADAYEKVTPEVAGRIKPGDVLNVSYYKLSHKVLVESCCYVGSDKRLVVKAIHYGRLSLLHSVTVMREEFQLDCDGASAWLHKFSNAVCYTAEETLARATSRLGERQHHPLYNNAATLAMWCRVRDHQRNRASVAIPRCDDNGKVLHELMPADHIDIQLLNHPIHGVLAAVESMNAANNWNLLTIVVLTEDLSGLIRDGLRIFAKSSYTMSSGHQLDKLKVPFQMGEVRKNADRYAGASLSWDCSDLQAMAFLATGVSAEPRDCQRTRTEVGDILPGHVILHNEQLHFVLAVHRPEKLDETFVIDTVLYAPITLSDRERTSQLRILVDTSRNREIQLVRHNEPDLNCSVLLGWKFGDAPLVTENAVEQVAELKPGDAVCIREDTTAYPLASQMPGLHAIVRTVASSASESDLSASQNPEDAIIEVICYTEANGPDGNMQTVGIRRVPVKGHQFSILVFNVHHSLLATRDEALQRALTRLGTGQYSCSWSNSRDLVRWCCVNHKANAPTYLGEVRGVNDVLSITSLGSGRLRLQQVETANGGSRSQDVCLIGATSSGDCPDLAKLQISGVNWQPCCVCLVDVDLAHEAAQLSRMQYDIDGDPDRESPASAITHLCSDAVSALLGASLVNASDCRLGAGVTDQDFCSWLLRCRRPGLSELPLLLSADPTTAVSSRRQVNEPISDPGCLRRWDHVVIERPQTRPLHMLLLNFDSESGVLSGYTYCPAVEKHDPSKQLGMFVYFPPQAVLHPMHKVAQRSPAADDASSVFSASLAAASQFPDDAAAWAQMAVLELESDLLVKSSAVNRLLKSLLQFAFRVAAKEVANDDTLSLCRGTLASPKFHAELQKAAEAMDESSTRRLYFLVRLIASCILGATS